MANQGAILNPVMVMLKPGDQDDPLPVNEATAMEFSVVKLVLEDTVDPVIPLPNVYGRVLKRVINCCNYSLGLHLIEPPSTEPQKFAQLAELYLIEEQNESIVELVKAADYLDIKVLLAFLMPSFKRRFGLGDDKGVEYVYTEELEAQLLEQAASASVSAGF